MSVLPVKVAVRVRPLIQKEIDEGCQICTNFIPYEPQIVLGKDKSFTYDYVFRPTDPQINVYDDAVKPLVRHIFKGYNATVLAYGQTGSGKTFTMGGGYEDSLKMDPDGMGIIPRIIQDIFTTIDEKEEYKYTVKLSYLEIINEDLQDLFVNHKRDTLSIREDNGIIKIPSLKEVEVTTTFDTMKYLEQGCNNRTTAATAMNNTSSRSHAIFSVLIEQQHVEDVTDYRKVKLQLVDLAGSERIKKTHAEGARLKEGININKGLLALGNVISILGDDTKKISHVPYRDSKLTRILQDSLGGNSHTLMIACVSPADSNMEETLSTLRYADRARKIKNKPVVNWDPQTAEIMRLKERVQQLTVRLIGVGVTDLDSESDVVHKPDTPTKEDAKSTCIQMWKDKCKEAEEEISKLHIELGESVDKCCILSAKALKSEMKFDRLRNRLKELEDEKIGMDLDLLSSSVIEDTDPVLAKQIQRLKAFASKLNESVITEESADDSVEGDNSMEMEGDVKSESAIGTPATPETLAMMKLHRKKQAHMYNELEELNQMLQKKEKLASQMTQNDEKMVSMKHQYEETMKHLEDEISSLQKEKETLSSALEDAKTNNAASKVSEQRRMRLKELEGQMTEIKKKLTEQRKMIKLKDQSDKKVTVLNTEIVALKQQRVRLIKQMKEDADQWRKWRQQKDKEVLHLQQKDRKRQFEIVKLQRENQRTQNVLQRKSEEASAANRRLKEALAKQKQVLDERSQKFEKLDKNAVGNRIKKWLSFELDVHVGIMEAKYHRESQLQDRKVFAEQLKEIRESVSDEGPPAKKMSWMDDSGRKHETSFDEEEKKKKITHLQQQIEIRNVQIAELQQKIFDAEQECKGKSTKDNLHTMMEAKIAIKWLLEQAVSYKADNNRLRLEMDDMKESMSGHNKDNDEYMEELEEKIEQIKKKYETDFTRLQSEHQKEIEVLLESAPVHSTDSDLKKIIESQKEEINKLKKINEELKVKSDQCNTMEKHLTKYMYTDKTVALMPELSADENTPPEASSPYLKLRPKVPASHRLASVLLGDSSIRSSDEFEKPTLPRIRKSVSAGMLGKKKAAKAKVLTSNSEEEEEDAPRKSLRKRNSKSKLPVNEDQDTKAELLRKLRKRSSRFDLKDIIGLDDDVDDGNDGDFENGEIPAKRRSRSKSTEVKSDGEVNSKRKPLCKKSSKSNIKVEPTEDTEDTSERKLRKRSSRFNLKDMKAVVESDDLPRRTRAETRRSKEDDSAASSLNETFTRDDSGTGTGKTSLNDTFTCDKDEPASSQHEMSSLLDGGFKKKRKLFNSKSGFFSSVEFQNELL